MNKLYDLGRVMEEISPASENIFLKIYEIERDAKRDRQQSAARKNQEFVEKKKLKETANMLPSTVTVDFFGKKYKVKTDLLDSDLDIEVAKKELAKFDAANGSKFKAAQRIILKQSLEFITDTIQHGEDTNPSHEKALNAKSLKEMIEIINLKPDRVLVMCDKPDQIILGVQCTGWPYDDYGFSFKWCKGRYVGCDSLSGSLEFYE